MNRTILAFGAVLFAAAGARAADRISYNRDVRPILAENCFACHGPDSAARKAKLRLDRHDDAVTAGALVPGKPGESEAVKRIFSDDPAELMPPPKSRKTLTAAEKDLLRRWVAAGAEYQPHWSLIAPTRPEPPAVKDVGWVRTPVDRFILAKLEAAGLKPAPEADRRTLARRLSLDLTGLPPEPADVEAFVNDAGADAYEKYVDRLMQSAHWGEHRGRSWLDAARYADTHGIHFDNFREIWSYRDWVIDAFNKNMRFDQFTVEQLAGDLLPNPTLEQRVATGFNRCNITTSEGGAIDEEYLVLYARDRTETVAQVWLGLTAGCAVCHDHKFDPLPTRDFYALAAFFNNTTQRAMDGNVKDTAPVLPVPRPEDRPRWRELTKQIADLRRQADARKQSARAGFDKWLASAALTDIAKEMPTAGLHLHAALDEGKGQAVKVAVRGEAREAKLGNGAAWDVGHVTAKALKIGKNGGALEVADAGDFDKDHGFSAGAWVKVPRRDLYGAVAARMDNTNEHRGWDLWCENGRFGTHIVHKWPADALKVVSKALVEPNQWNHVLVTYDGSGKAAGVKVFLNGVPQETEVLNDSLKQTTRTPVPFKVGQRHTTDKLSGATIQDLRVYDRALSPAEAERLVRSSRVRSVASKPAEKRTDKEKEDLFAWWLGANDGPYRELNARAAKLQQEEAPLRSRGTIAHVMQERPEMPVAYVLSRGEYDKRRDAVKPDVPKALPPLPPGLPHDRLGFAKWLLRPEQPLTARVTVNRFWQELYGNGLVRSAGDFGVTGELPSHPELLDWLAVEFRETGWDVKRFFKTLVLSAAYRQAATTTAEKLQKDPQNRLLSRGPRYRMDAEMVRDYALAAGGLLSHKIGGPSVKPYQPDGVWEAVAIIGSNTRDYRRDAGESLYRRSMYTFWKRSAPPASLDIFNAPNRETCAVRRERTNTPLQALVTLNDPQFVEAARHLATAALKDGGLDTMAKRLLARPFREEERAVVKTSLDGLLAHYRGHAAEAKKLLAVGESKADPTLDVPTLAAYTMLANELMNLDEVLNK